MYLQETAFIIIRQTVDILSSPICFVKLMDKSKSYEGFGWYVSENFIQNIPKMFMLLLYST